MWVYQEDPLERLSHLIYEKCKLSRIFVHSGEYIFKIYNAKVLGISITVEGYGLSAAYAIHNALDRIEEIKRSMSIS